MSDGETIVAFERFAGHDEYDRRVTVTVEIRRLTSKHHGQYQTINHQTIQHPLELSITTWAKKGHDEGGGAVIPDLMSYAMPEADYKALQQYFTDWHLNTLRAACVHQDRGAHVGVADWQTMSQEQTAKCPNGYVYGSAWLVNPLPASVVSHIERIAGHE